MWRMKLENKIFQGDALTKLKELPEKSINMCMTSPPYWALRDYGDSVNSIWEGLEDCEHDFEIGERYIHRGSAPNTVHGAINAGGLKVDWKTKDGFCNRCGAWKGQLGLEPTFDLYIKHLCDIFDEVKRVLRDDGTCWVNMGDTYASSPSGLTNEKAEEGSTRKGSDGLYKRLHKRHSNDMTSNVTPKPKEYGNVQNKSLVMIPFRFAIEMVNRGWILRNTIIWHKPNCMPSSVKDRFTVDFEYIFFFSKKKKYYFETQYEPHLTNSIKRMDAGFNQNQDFNYKKRIDKNRGFKTKPNKGQLQPLQKHGQDVSYNPQGRNKRAVWKISPRPFKETHFAVYPEELCETPIKAGCPKDGIVLDPFFGAGTTGLVALKQNKKFVGIELNKEYIKIAKKRLKPFLEQEKLFRNFMDTDSPEKGKINNGPKKTKPNNH